jgi:hypothetical protein
MRGLDGRRLARTGRNHAATEIIREQAACQPQVVPEAEIRWQVRVLTTLR